MFLPFYTAPLFISNASPASFEAGLILFYFVLSSYPEREFNHRYHQDEEKDEVEWHYLKAYSVAEQPEQRGNEGRADIGARHLYSDYDRPNQPVTAAHQDHGAQPSPIMTKAAAARK